MQEFAIAPQALMQLPVRWFWSMARHVPRLRAERDLQTLNLQAAAAGVAQGSTEFFNEIRGNLLEQIGSVTRAKEKSATHEEKLAFLRANT